VLRSFAFYPKGRRIKDEGGFCFMPLPFFCFILTNLASSYSPLLRYICRSLGAGRSGFYNCGNLAESGKGMALSFALYPKGRRMLGKNTILFITLVI